MRTNPSVTSLTAVTTATVLAVFTLLGPSGCTTTTSGPQRPVSANQTQQIRQTAENSDAVPVQMLLTVGTPTDSNDNRYMDTIPVIVYLFPPQSNSRLPVWSRGLFRFELRDESGELLTAWEFSEDLATGARVSMAPGPGYSFFLRFADGLDTQIEGKASLNGIFTLKNGSQASSNGGASVRLGKR
ncbi:MAG: hypothetical protein ACI89L_000194 [Phycisphaerales bacterium]|jgi:hypothetical protein